MNNAVFIYNTKSGKGIKQKKLNNIITFLKTEYQNLVLCPTKNIGDAKNYTQIYLTCADIFIVLGGDGTINDVISAIASTNYSPKLIILPNGTMNDLAHNYKIPKNYKKIIALAKNNCFKTCDLIKVNNTYAIYGFALGRFSATSYNTSQKAKKMFGKIAYFTNALNELFNYTPININIKLKNKNLAGKYALILITNSCYVAGFKINKNNKNKTKLILIKDAEKFKNISTFLSILKLFLFGINKASCDKLTTVVDFEKMQIISDTTYKYVLDGEEFSSNNFDIQIIPKRIKICCNCS